MSLRRGDVVIVSAAGDYGKPRPAVVMQSGAMPDAHASAVLCQMTSSLIDAPDFRIAIEPKPGNGLRERSQVMADKPVTLMRSRISDPIGRLDPEETARIAAAIAFVIGLSTDLLVASRLMRTANSYPSVAGCDAAPAVRDRLATV